MSEPSELDANVFTQDDILLIGGYLASSPPMDDDSDSALPEVDTILIQQLANDPLFTTDNSYTKDDIVPCVNTFLDDYYLKHLIPESKASQKDGTMVVDPISIAITTAIFLLIQTEVKISASKDTEGKSTWKFDLHYKPGKPSDSLKALIKILSIHL